MSLSTTPQVSKVFKTCVSSGNSGLEQPKITGCGDFKKWKIWLWDDHCSKMFKIPLLFHWILVGVFRHSPFLDDHNPQDFWGSTIPKLIIKQQGWIAATAQMADFLTGSWGSFDGTNVNTAPQVGVQFSGALDVDTSGCLKTVPQNGSYWCVSRREWMGMEEWE